jgi:hypothetical protein
MPRADMHIFAVEMIFLDLPVANEGNALVEYLGNLSFNAF